MPQHDPNKENTENNTLDHSLENKQITNKTNNKQRSNITNLVVDSPPPTDLRGKLEELPTILFKRLTPENIHPHGHPLFYYTKNSPTKVILSVSPPVPLPVVISAFFTRIIDG